MAFDIDHFVNVGYAVAVLFGLFDFLKKNK
jgi:hypothetical protein